MKLNWEPGISHHCPYPSNVTKLIREFPFGSEGLKFLYETSWLLFTLTHLSSISSSETPIAIQLNGNPGCIKNVLNSSFSSTSVGTGKRAPSALQTTLAE